MNIDELRKIKTWAPSGATDFQEFECGAIIYWRLIPFFAFKYECEEWIEIEELDLISTRSIADITTIIEQADRIAELEAKCDDLLVAFTQDIYETGELSFSDSQWVCSFAAEWDNKAGDL